MKIGIASDHRGYQLKEQIINALKESYEIIDCGTTGEDPVDYPDYAFLLSKKVKDNEIDFGVAICGSGIGISIACNKVKGIRCAKVSNIEEAKYTRQDNDANIIAFSADTKVDDAISYVKTFVETPFSNEERHQRRINKITEYEENN